MKKIKPKEELFYDTQSCNIEMYCSKWWIVFTNDMKGHYVHALKAAGATDKEIKRQTRDLKHVTGRVSNIELKNGKYFDVCVFDINKYSYNVGVHEAFHIVKDILYTRGLRIDETASSEEPWAYLLGNVYDNINEAYTKSYKSYKTFKKEQAILKKTTNEKAQ